MTAFSATGHAAILRSFAHAIELNWLRPIAHGYCFTCAHEAIVYDVLIGPTQPPRCASCFISAMINHADDDDLNTFNPARDDPRDIGN
jgi:hypothetical protein